MSTINRWMKQIQFGLFPGQCILCLTKTERLIDLCLACELELPKIRNPCWQCGLPIPAEQEVCGTCITTPPLYSHCFSAFEYAPPIDRLISQFKNQHKLVVGKVLSTVLAKNYLKHHLVFPDFWLPVPLHKNKLKERGFNQALEIAEVMSDYTRLPIQTQLCRRIVETSDQKQLNRKARAKNLKDVFSMDEILHGQSIAIVDDIVTTTATISALTELLLNQGAGEIQIVSLARTPAH